MATTLGIEEVVIGSNMYGVRLADGSLRSWGNGGGGSDGYENGDIVGYYETPGDYYATLPGAGVVDVGGSVLMEGYGAGHRCALLTTGGVRCWGPADGGFSYGDFYDDSECILNQGGDSSLCDIGDEPGEMPPPNVELSATADMLSTGWAHTCIRTTAGTVRCWGNCALWNCGYGVQPDPFASLGGMAPPADYYATLPFGGDLDLGPGTVVEFDGGQFFHCARFSDDTVRCWGTNSAGQLGYGTTETIGDDETPGAWWSAAPSGGAIDLGGVTAAQVSVG